MEAEHYSFFAEAPTEAIQSAIPITERFIMRYSRIACAVSGGSDSDIMLDMVTRLDKNKKVSYYFVDTGIEMDATKAHISYLERKYGITIEIKKPNELKAAYKTVAKEDESVKRKNHDNVR